MTRFGAVIFDMDGVLIDSEPLHFEVANEVLGSVGHSLSREENEEFIGTTTEFFWDTLIDRKGLPHPKPYFDELYDQAVLRILSRTWPAADGVSALIDKLRSTRVPLAVASSAKRTWIDATLRSIGLSSVFHVVVAGDEVAHGKPAPDIYLLAAERLGIPASKCLAIEDSPNGILSATRAGMTVVGVRTPYTAHLSLDGAATVVDSLTELDPFADW